MTEAQGVYTATIPPLAPNLGDARITIDFACPDTTTPTVAFDVYIDPSGKVVDQLNHPISGATVTLLRSDDFSGPFDAVPSGSGIMASTNQTNPDLTDNRGLFGWDVLAGFYIVRAAAPGCVSPDDSSQAFVETPVLTVPPTTSGLVLQMDCLPRIGIGNASVLEGQTGSRPIAVPITLSEVATTNVTVHYQTIASTADAADFTAKTGTVTIPAGQMSGKVSIGVKGDAVAEPNQKFFVKLSAPVGAAISRSQATVTVLNDDPGAAGKIGISSASVLEGTNGTRSLVFTVSLSSAATKNVTANYTTVDGTAVAGEDYVAKSGSVQIVAGKLSTTISIDVNGDTNIEPNQAFTVKLSGPKNAKFGTSIGTATILNDD